MLRGASSPTSISSQYSLFSRRIHATTQRACGGKTQRPHRVREQTNKKGPNARMLIVPHHPGLLSLNQQGFPRWRAVYASRMYGSSSPKTRKKKAKLAGVNYIAPGAVGRVPRRSAAVNQHIHVFVSSRDERHPRHIHATTSFFFP